MGFKFAQRIQKFSEQKIGLKRADIRLEPYNPRWKRLFSDEACFIFDELRNESLRLYHWGSTSVPNLASKPIIDILGSVQSLDELDLQKQRLEAIGYEYKGEYGIKGRRYCVLYNPEKTMAFVHLHIFQYGDIEIEKNLKLRDHLRNSVEDLEIYLKHKQYLIYEAKINRNQYSDAKNEVLLKIKERAAEKSTQPKKILAVLAAAEGHKNTAKFLSECYKNSEIEIIELKPSCISPHSYLGNSADAFHSIIRKALHSDLLVLATPVYWYAMSGVMKNFMDRFSDLMKGEHKQLGEALYGKRVQLVSTGFSLNLPLGFEVPFVSTAMYFGMDYMGAIYKSM